MCLDKKKKTKPTFTSIDPSKPITEKDVENPPKLSTMTGETSSPPPKLPPMTGEIAPVVPDETPTPLTGVSGSVEVNTGP